VSKWREEKKLVLEAARKMLEKGLVVGTSGNVSLRLPPENGRELLAVTPTSRYYDRLGIDDIQVVDFEVEPVEGDLPPSVETMLHIGIYRARQSVNAVIHTHSVYASALSVMGTDIPPILEDQVVFIGGQIKLSKHAPPGSEELAGNVIAALEDRNAVLLPNHGAIGVGRTLREAFTVCELTEKTAKIYYLALTLGKVNLLPDETLQAAQAFFTMLQSQVDEGDTGII
jgi:L-fuculose-phosphate aldolase